MNYLLDTSVVVRYLRNKPGAWELVEKLRIEILVLTVKSMEIYASARRQLEKKGEGLDDLDLLIGATAVENDVVLVTDNGKHFARFSKLKLIGT